MVVNNESLQSIKVNSISSSHAIGSRSLSCSYNEKSSHIHLELDVIYTSHTVPVQTFSLSDSTSVKKSTKQVTLVFTFRHAIELHKVYKIHLQAHPETFSLTFSLSAFQHHSKSWFLTFTVQDVFFRQVSFCKCWWFGDKQVFALVQSWNPESVWPCPKSTKCAGASLTVLECSYISPFCHCHFYASFLNVFLTFNISLLCQAYIVVF